MTKIQSTLGVQPELMGCYLLLYAAFLLLAFLSWSIAFIHREREMMLVETVGLLTTLAPIAMIVVGHVVVSAGALLGIGNSENRAQ